MANSLRLMQTPRMIDDLPHRTRFLRIRDVFLDIKGEIVTVFVVGGSGVNVAGEEGCSLRALYVKKKGAGQHCLRRL